MSQPAYAIAFRNGHSLYGIPTKDPPMRDEESKPPPFVHQHQCAGGRGVPPHVLSCDVMICRDQPVKTCFPCKVRGAEPGPPR